MAVFCAFTGGLISPLEALLSIFCEEEIKDF
jgi:hypothetical protein